MAENLRWPTGAEVRHKSRFAAARCYMTPPGPATRESAGSIRAWWSRRGELRAAPEGRGSALFIEADGRRLVLRHYRRGGWMARLMGDRYLWRGEALTRSFVEWHLLYVMRRAGLPVPVPIAARYRRIGRYSYTADLLTEQIPALARWRAGCARAAAADRRGLRSAAACAAFTTTASVMPISMRTTCCSMMGIGMAGRFRSRAGCATRDSGVTPIWCGCGVRWRKSVPTLPPENFTEADWASLLDGYFAAQTAGEAVEPAVPSR